MASFSFSYADNDELDRILKGSVLPASYPWPRKMLPRRRSSLETGVLVEDSVLSSSARVAAIIVSEEVGRHLFGRYSQLRGDLSPLSAWTHVLDWRYFEQLSSETKKADLGGFEASWIGLIVAEALMLSERPLVNLKLAACLATPSFALARAQALWSSENIESVLKRYDQGQKLLRTGDGGGTNKLREPFSDIWRSLLAAKTGREHEAPHELRSVTKALLNLRFARQEKASESRALRDAFSSPEAEFLSRLEDTPAEGRLHDFDRLVARIDTVPADERGYRNELQFLAGYLASVAAGGAPSLGLADRLAHRLPQILAWAYAIGGVGEAATWTSAFDGLGRLVARDLLRPFRLDDAPLSDFSLDEALVLVDRALQDPFVHLRVKQSRFLSVAILPGVNVLVPFGEIPREIRQTQPVQRHEYLAGMPLSALADALWPYIERRLSRSLDFARRSGKSRGAGKDQTLPLDSESK